MRVLISSQHFWPESFRINDVARSLNQAGCEIEIITGQPNYPDGNIFPGYRAGAMNWQIHDGMRVNRLPIAPRAGGGAFRLALNYLSFVFSGLILGPLALWRRPFDVVFVYGTSPILQAIPAIFLGWIKRAPVVLWVQDLWPESLEVTGFVRNRAALGAVSAVVRWIYRRCDLILVQSDAFLPAVEAMAGTVPIRVHHNPGETMDTVTDPPAPGLGGEFAVVFAGNLGTVQALDTILDAAGQLRDLPGIRFAFIGSGSRGGWLADEIALRGLENCTLVGRLPPSEMPRIFAQAAVLLVTLVRNPAMEMTVPSKIQAYLAAGKPIIAALGGAGANVVAAAGAGIICAAEQPVALAAAVRMLHAMDDGERHAMGAAGRRYFEAHYAPAVLTPRLLAAFSYTIDRRKTRGKAQ